MPVIRSEHTQHVIHQHSTRVGKPEQTLPVKPFEDTFTILMQSINLDLSPPPLLEELTKALTNNPQIDADLLRLSNSITHSNYEDILESLYVAASKKTGDNTTLITLCMAFIEVLDIDKQALKPFERGDAVSRIHKSKTLVEIDPLHDIFPLSFTKEPSIGKILSLLDDRLFQVRMKPTHTEPMKQRAHLRKDITPFNQLRLRAQLIHQFENILKGNIKPEQKEDLLRMSKHHLTTLSREKVFNSPIYDMLTIHSILESGLRVALSRNPKLPKDDIKRKCMEIANTLMPEQTLSSVSEEPPTTEKLVQEHTDIIKTLEDTQKRLDSIKPSTTHAITLNAEATFEASYKAYQDNLQSFVEEQKKLEAVKEVARKLPDNYGRIKFSMNQDMDKRFELMTQETRDARLEIARLTVEKVLNEKQQTLNEEHIKTLNIKKSELRTIEQDVQHSPELKRALTLELDVDNKRADSNQLLPRIETLLNDISGRIESCKEQQVNIAKQYMISGIQARL